MAQHPTEPYKQDSMLLYSIQQTYIIKPVYKSENTMPKHIIKSAPKPEITILTCDQRIDIPTIEPLTHVEATAYAVDYLGDTSTVVPCIELAGKFLSEFNLTFETNEGVTVLPIRIPEGLGALLDNPYLYDRYVLVLPRGATGVKSCKLINKATGKEVQHNFTFGIMPPPYNYDNALFGYLSYRSLQNYERIMELINKKTFYGYINKNGVHAIDFSKPGSTFIINPETRFIVFSLTNASSENVSFEITLTPVNNENIHTKSTAIIPSGRSTIKIDLQSLEMYVMSDDNIAENVYRVSGIDCLCYGGINFGYIPNQNLTGNVEVREWA